MNLDTKTYNYATIAVLIAFLLFASVCAFLFATNKPVPPELWSIVSGAFGGLIGMVTHKEKDAIQQNVLPTPIIQDSSN